MKVSRFSIKGAVAELARIDVPFAIKASAIDANARTFEGLASVWGRDLGDDIMHSGAFKETIAEWEKSKDAIPLLNSHNHYDILSAVGQLLEAKETADGLWTKWEVIDGAEGDAVLARLRPSQRTGRAPVSKMSIGYEPLKVDFEASDNARFGQVRNVRKVALKEVSLVIFPMAPGARIDTQTVKQWTESVERVDRESATPELKQYLRRLASKIGAVLAPIRKAGDEVQEPAEPPAAVPPPVPAEPPAPVPAAPAAAAEPAPSAPEPKEESAYLYAEALQQRLLRIRNHSVIHNTGAVR